MVSVRAARLAQRKSSIKDGCDLCVPRLPGFASFPRSRAAAGLWCREGTEAPPLLRLPLWKEWVSELRLPPHQPGPGEGSPLSRLPAQRPHPPAPAQGWAAALKGCFKEQTTPLPGHDGAWGIPQIVQPLQPDRVFLSHWRWEIAQGPVTGGHGSSVCCCSGPIPCFPDLSGSCRPHLPVSFCSALDSELSWGPPFQAKVPETCLLTIRVLQAHGLPSKDLVTPPDCYVTLWLPTASSQRLQTRTVNNSRNPIWNQSFRFRIHRQLKNVVQLQVFDQDLLTSDDPVLSVLYDVGTLRIGEFRCERFLGSPQGEEPQLEVEFRLQSVTDCAERLVSNGILVAREVSRLHVRLEEAGDQKASEGRVQLVVPGSCEGPQEASVGTASRFHCLACWEPELRIHLQDAPQEQLKVPLRALPSGQVVRLVFPTSQEPLMRVELKKEEGPTELAVRLGCGPCAEEHAFLSRRKQVVAKALKQALQLDGDLPEDEIPVVAVMATGGGIRAMTSLYGQLAGLRELGLLDCVSYITGASGSTWALANLYEDPEWSQKDLAGPTELLKTQVTKSKLGVLAPRQLRRYRQELAERARLGHPACFTNLWALINEALLHDEPHDHKLSDQRAALGRGQNPLPIYCALNTKGRNLTTFEFGEWCEFSPYEVGFPKYGAFIPSELFGSEFFMGRLTKQLPESRICFLEGIWSNLYAANLQDSLYWASEPSQFWDRWAQDQASLDKEQVPLLKIEEPPTVAGRIAEFFTDLLTRRPLPQATHNFLRGLHFHKDYFQHPHFSSWKATKLDGLPNQLTPAEPHLCLLDVGYFINTSCPPLLRPTREVDLILSLDYNLHGAFQQLQLLGRFCQEQGIPFPPISPSPEEQQQPRECHLFLDPDRPEAPAVLHFPLVNDSFREHSAPGVRRAAEEKEAGEVNLSPSDSPYHYSKVTYSQEDMGKLLHLTHYNICNNQEQLLGALREAVQRRRQRKQRGPSDGGSLAGGSSP